MGENMKNLAVIAVSLFFFGCLSANNGFMSNNENASSNVQPAASISINNETNDTFIIFGEFVGVPRFIKKGEQIVLPFKSDEQPFKSDIYKVGPQTFFILPNDLILYADDSQEIQDELSKMWKKEQPNLAVLTSAIKNHIKSRVHYVLEGAGGLRFGMYHAVAGDKITLHKDGKASVVGSSKFLSSLRLKRVND